jgi:hypothetical protein
MFYVIIILAGIFAMPAKALDGTSSPANVAPPIWVGPTLNMPDGEYWHNPNLLDEFQRLAQATPGGSGVDPLIGTWKMNPAKSTATGFEIDKSLTLVFTKDGQDIALKLETIDAKNQMSKSVLKHIYDGKPHPGIGDPNTDAIAYTRMGNPISWVRFQNGRPVAVGQGVVDGNTYTSITGGIIANQPTYSVYVYDRQ